MPSRWLLLKSPNLKMIIATIIAAMVLVLAPARFTSAQATKSQATKSQATKSQGTKSQGLGVTAPEQFKLIDGFSVDLVHEVESGSWVSMTIDPKGRLIACDQYGGLFRIDVSGDAAVVEPLSIELQGAQGLLCAFDSLYANVNSKDFPAGVWRLTDTNGDDQYDTKEHLIQLNAGGEHGPHALILSQDKQRIIMCAGNNTVLPTDDIVRSRVPMNWDEDHLLGRMPDARGHNADRLAPGGFIASFAPDGSDLELIATGFRNQYDIALNSDGELFSYDADMEWDVGTPWYRPTRINHVISGAEFGWRNGTGKWPAYYPDSFGASVDIGPGSPTGICFGYGTKFPKKYQDALFICDWSYGNIHAVHLTPDGSSYSGTYETFATAAPLPVTDLVVRPEDGSMYVTIGGRRTQSALYRISYTGEPSEADNTEAEEAKNDKPSKRIARQRATRQRLESMHNAKPRPKAMPNILKQLGSNDRAISFAARIALEHQPVDQWRDQVIALENPAARMLGIIALARNGEASDAQAATKALLEVSWKDLSNTERITLLRAYALVAMRLEAFDDDTKNQILKQQLGGQFPTGDDAVDRELAQVLVYLDQPEATPAIIAAMQSSPSQESQINYAMTLRNAKAGWTPETRQDYFGWFQSIASARGGASFGGFLKNIKEAALETVPEDAMAALEDVLKEKTDDQAEQQESRAFVKKWTTEELLPVINESSHSPDFERGKEVFAAGACYKCHRMGVQGGILGPDLTGVGGRFSVKDLIDSMVHPSMVISDQYGATQFLTDDGRVVSGRVVNMSGKDLRIMTNMLDPAKQTTIKRDQIETTRESRTSMMPEGLLDTFSAEEIIDLIAYLRSGGRAQHEIYRTTVSTSTSDDDRQWLVFPGEDGKPGSGKHIVLISGDHEYRSEEAFPQLAKILSLQHGFKCTVLFAIDPKTGVIDPEVIDNIPGLESLETADLAILGLRFRNLPDDQMKRIMDYTEAGKPLMALRTSTHPFNIPKDRKYASETWNIKEGDDKGGYGRKVLGETWVAHHGKHGKESTRGIIADADHPIVTGIEAGEIWGPTDVYRVTLPLSGDGHAVLLGQILTGMDSADEPVTDGRNDPLMPIAWTRSYNGGRVFTTTMGSADDLPSDGVRRMLVNAAYWCAGIEDQIDGDTDVSIVGDYEPTKFGFGGFIRGKKPADYDLQPALN